MIDQAIACWHRCDTRSHCGIGNFTPPLAKRTARHRHWGRNLRWNAPGKQRLRDSTMPVSLRQILVVRVRRVPDP
jgi:hypothetical protein